VRIGVKFVECPQTSSYEYHVKPFATTI